MQPVRFRGIVRGAREGEVQLVRASLEVPPAPATRGDVTCSFDLELEDGARIALDTSFAGLTVVPERTQRASWGTLENELAAAPFRQAAPGPHLTVTLKSAAASDGDVIEVYGEPTDHTFDEAGATTRDAPKQRVSRVRALVVGVGPDARAALDAAIDLRKRSDAAEAERKANAEREQHAAVLPSRRYLVWLAVALVALTVAAAMPLSPLTVDVLACAMGLVASGLYFWWRARAPDLFEADVRIVRSFLDSGGILVALVAVGMSTFPMIIEDAPPNRLAYRTREIVNWSEVSVVCWAAYIACLGVAVYRASRRSSRVFSTILSAPPHPAPPFTKTWGFTMGTVATPTPADLNGEAVAIAMVTEEDLSKGESPGQLGNFATDRTLREGSFFVEGPTGTMEVHPRAAVWGSAVRRRLAQRRPPKAREMEAVRADVIPIGGAVLVAGRASRATAGGPGSIEATGPESLLFYAGPAGSDPRAALTSAIRRRQVVLAMLALLTFGVFAGGTALAMSVAPMNFSSRR